MGWVVLTPDKISRIQASDKLSTAQISGVGIARSRRTRSSATCLQLFLLLAKPIHGSVQQFPSSLLFSLIRRFGGQSTTA